MLTEEQVALVLAILDAIDETGAWEDVELYLESRYNYKDAESEVGQLEFALLGE